MAKDPSPKKIYGLIGYPVRHSFSPAMHNAAFQALKINAEYRLFALKEEELKDFLKDLKKNGIFGLNVTIPYKEKVIPFLDGLSKEANLIGAVNTVKRLDGKLEGFNTDGEGFLKHLACDLRLDPKDKSIAIIGAGGAAKAVAVYLSKAKPKRISIYDIDKAKASGLISYLKKNFYEVEFIEADSIAGLDIQNSHLLINATPLGMKETDPCLVAEGFLHKNLLVYDLIYNPKETKLLRLAKDKAIKFSNGLGMLLYQGVRAFEIWTGVPAPIDAMRQALGKELEICRK